MRQLLPGCTCPPEGGFHTSVQCNRSIFGIAAEFPAMISPSFSPSSLLPSLPTSFPSFLSPLLPLFLLPSFPELFLECLGAKYWEDSNEQDPEDSCSVELVF